MATTATITTNFTKFLPKVAGSTSKPSGFGVQSSPIQGGLQTRVLTKCTLGKMKPSSSSKVRDASLTAVVAAATAAAGPALALVDERMSTEGTGLPFGLSNNLLGWILLGVFGLIWALYFVYTTGLDEDDDSGLSLLSKSISFFMPCTYSSIL